MCIRRILNEYVVLDIETTGFNPEKDQIIEVAVCKVKDGNIVDEYTAFVNSKQPIHQSINGFTNDKLNNAETIDKVMPKLLEFIGQLPIVVHDAYLVMGFLKKNCNNIDLSLDNEVIDIFPLCKKQLPYLKNYKVSTISDFLGNTDVMVDGIIDYTRLICKVFENIRDVS